MQFSPRIFGCEAPLDLGLGGVAFLLQFFELSFERLFITDAPRQTLSAEDARFNFHHVQPTAEIKKYLWEWMSRLEIGAESGK